MKSPEVLTIQDIQLAHQTYEKNEPRDLFYRAATELVELALHGKTSLSIAEALAVLLQTWNKAFYQYNRFDGQHFSDIERLVRDYQQVLADFRERSLESFCDDDKAIIEKVFKSFEQVLGPVGAAKCLHLMAPHFFPLWDRAIAAARAYKLALKPTGENGKRYCRFMEIVQDQCRHLGWEQGVWQNPLKAIDEYNYCKYTKRWLLE